VGVQEEHSSPLYIEQALFRVAQEALSNVGKHSQATAAEISLNQGINKVSLTITDRGCGFDPAVVQGKGLGLHSMRERIEALNGTFQVISTLGEGTQILVTLPLPEALPD
jgi:signal transduction histidine kinase